MINKIKEVNKQLIDKTPIPVIRGELIMGEKSISAFMDAHGKYYMNFTQLEELLGVYKDSFFGFLVRSGHFENPNNATYRELRSLWGKGLGLPNGVFYVQTETGGTFRPAELDLIAKFILDQAYKGNKSAQVLNNALLLESLQIRCEAQFVGVSPNVLDIHYVTNIWLSSRQANKSVHGAFVQYCIKAKLPGKYVHESMTSHVFGQTKRQAITCNKLVGEDPTIGLDYQDDVDGQLLLAKVKVKFMSYNKGTWQERVDRSYLESI